MASGEKAPVPLKYQTWVLKVLIHCEGCKRKVRRVLHGIEGVYTTTIDAQQQQVTVIGDIDAAALIKKLAKSGKRAELLPSKPQHKEKHNESKKKKDNDKNSQGKNKNEVTGKPTIDHLEEDQVLEEEGGKPDSKRKPSKKTTTTNEDPSTNVDDPSEKPNVENNKPKSKNKHAGGDGAREKPVGKNASKERNGGGPKDIQPALVVSQQQENLQSEGHLPTSVCVASCSTVSPSMSSGYYFVQSAVPPCYVYPPHLNGCWYYYVPVEDGTASTPCSMM